MAKGRRPTYEVADYEVLAETPELRMVVLTLGEGQEVPWHRHTHVTNRLFCMQGPMVVETRAPREAFELNPGDTCIVPAWRAHHVMARMAAHASSASSRASAFTTSIQSASGAP
jgi:quercetin dioxygenase-like cupin family protein